MMRTNESGLQRSAAKGARFLPPVALRLLAAALALAVAAGAFASSAFAQQSNNASLSAMTFNQANGNAIPGIIISPTFTSSTTTYGVAIVETIATVTAAPTGHASASYQYFKDGSATALTDATPGGTFQIALNTRATTIKVTVTAEDGTTTQDYTFHVYRNAGDHDIDDNGYIEVWTRPQLEAIYYDSQPTHEPNLPAQFGLSADATALAAYLRAFPMNGGIPANGSFPIGCGTGTCLGYELSQDIDLAGADWLAGIRNPTSVPYNSTLLGNGFAIQNLRSNLRGFMGTLGSNGRIENLRLENVSITAAVNQRTGGLVGSLAGGTIRNVHVTGTVGTNVRTATDPIGGLVGWMQGGRIESSSFTGVVTGSCDKIGGLVGQTRLGHAAGVSSPADNVIIASHARARVISDCPGGSSDRRVGGLVGASPNTLIVASYAAGSVEARNGGLAGGLVGQLGGYSVVDRSYAAVRVTRGTNLGADVVGGLIGGVVTTATVNNSYWDSGLTTDSRSLTNIGAGKTRAQFTTGLTAFPATGDFSTWNDALSLTVPSDVRTPATTMSVSLPLAPHAWTLWRSTYYPVLHGGYPRDQIIAQAAAQDVWFDSAANTPVTLRYKDGYNTVTHSSSWTPTTWATSTYAYTIPVYTRGQYVTIEPSAGAAGSQLVEIVSPADSQSGVAGHQVNIPTAELTTNPVVSVILGRAHGAEHEVGFFRQYSFTLDQFHTEGPLAPATLSATGRVGVVRLTWPDIRSDDTSITGYQVCQAAAVGSCTWTTLPAIALPAAATLGSNVVDRGASLEYDYDASGLSTTVASNFWVRAVNTTPTPDLISAASPVASATPLADSQPGFGPTLSPLSYLEGTNVTITLPAVTGGDGAVSYSVASGGVVQTAPAPQPGATTPTLTALGLALSTVSGRATLSGTLRSDLSANTTVHDHPSRSRTRTPRTPIRPCRW